MTGDPRIAALPDSHGHAKGEHKPFAEERPIPYTARMLFLWFYHACRRGAPRFMMVADHINYLTFEDPAATNLVRRALKLAQAGDLYGAAETAGVELNHAAVVSEGLRRGMRCSIGAELDNDPRNRPDAQNIVDAMRPDGMIRAVHFVPITHPQHGENWMWAFDNPDFKELFDVVGTERTWEIYMATLLEAIGKLPGHIVAHFYGPAKFGHWPDDAALERYEDQVLDACAERGIAIEVNSRYFYRYFADDEAQSEKYRAVNLRLLRKAKAKGVAVAVGSGAHSPKDQGAAFETVLALLDEADINEIAFPLEGRLARVALRVTDDLLRQESGYAVDSGSVAVPLGAAEQAAPQEGVSTATSDDAVIESKPKPQRSRRVRPSRSRSALADAAAAAAPSGAISEAAAGAQASEPAATDARSDAAQTPTNLAGSRVVQRRAPDSAPAQHGKRAAGPDKSPVEPVAKSPRTPPARRTVAARAAKTRPIKRAAVKSTAPKSKATAAGSAANRKRSGKATQRAGSTAKKAAASKKATAGGPSAAARKTLRSKGAAKRSRARKTSPKTVKGTASGKRSVASAKKTPSKKLSVKATTKKKSARSRR